MIRLRAFPWGLWTSIRAAFAYADGKISRGEFHMRIGIARLAIGRDEVDVDEAAEKHGDD